VAEIASRENLSGNQIAHDAAMQEAKNTLESDLQAARIASQEGITTVELQNRIDLQASQITATENQYLADIASRENISTADLANRLALNAADISSREALAGRQITHEDALAKAKNTLEREIQDVAQTYDLARMEADTANRMELTAADYAGKTSLSAVEHEEFKDKVVLEYGLRRSSQALVDAALNYRAELAAETSRMVSERGFDAGAMELAASMEETQMEQWVEINKMVFHPDDPELDATYRQEAINALDAEYTERKTFLGAFYTGLEGFDWDSVLDQPDLSVAQGPIGKTSEESDTGTGQRIDDMQEMDIEDTEQKINGLLGRIEELEAQKTAQPTADTQSETIPPEPTQTTQTTQPAADTQTTQLDIQPAEAPRSPGRATESEEIAALSGLDYSKADTWKNIDTYAKEYDISDEELADLANKMDPDREVPITAGDIASAMSPIR
jgi:hypothetical protein